jgi:hypothetical protein
VVAPIRYTPTSLVQCPSAPPEWKGSAAIGLVLGTSDKPRVVPLREPVPSDHPAFCSNGAGVEITEAVRFAAPCAHAGCAEFVNNRCNLATRIVENIPAVTDRLPFCLIRAACRWWRQEGEAACLRCPQVVTDNRKPSAAMKAVLESSPLQQQI